MKLSQITEAKKVLIIKNLLKAVRAVDDLNPHGYAFISSANGFIAHYDIDGFKSYYRGAGGLLKQDIFDNANSNMWLNFKPGDIGYHYYMDKADVYRRLIIELNKKATKRGKGPRMIC